MDLEPRIMSVFKIRAKCDPFKGCCWPGLDRPITIEEVAEAMKHSVEPKSRRQEHVAAISQYVINGWDDPIAIDVGVPSMGCCPAWLIQDGNHRFAAAIVRGDDTITVNASGVVDLIDALCA